MKYSQKQITDFNEKYHEVLDDLREVMFRATSEGQRAESEKVKEHLLYGVSRRLGVIRKAFENIFNLFPPDIASPLDQDALYDVQINMHAYMINLAGIFENFAWAFVEYHELLEDVGGKHGIGMFRRGTAKLLPEPISKYISDNDLYSWHSVYLKSFRDALAHRIPLYIPPSTMTQEEGERFNEIESIKLDLVMAMNFSELEKVEREQKRLGHPCFFFLHSFNEEESRQIYLHPQIISDGMAITEFGSVFFDSWHERA